MTPIGSPVMAQIGLVLRLRSSFSQISLRIAVLIGVSDPGPLEGGRDRLDAPRGGAVGLAQREAVLRPGRIADHPGFDDHVGRIDHAADDALEADRAGQHPARVEPRQVGARQAVVGAAVEIPPRDAVHREHDAGVGADQRHHRRRRVGQGRRFQRDEHDVLHAQRFGSVGGADARVGALVADPQGQAALADRGELGAARHRRHLDAGPCRAGPEPGGDMAANRAGAENDDLHRVIPYRLAAMQSVLSSPFRQAAIARNAGALRVVGARSGDRPVRATPGHRRVLDGRGQAPRRCRGAGLRAGTTRHPALTGRTDKAGKFEFPANEEGLWSAEARTADQIGRVTVRVGGPDQEQEQEPLSPVWAIAGLLVLLVLAFGYRGHARPQPERQIVDIVVTSAQEPPMTALPAASVTAARGLSSGRGPGASSRATRTPPGPSPIRGHCL